MTIEDLEIRLANWHRQRYGDKPVDLLRTCIKAQEELGELARAILRGDNENACEEAADVAITLVHLVRGMRGSLFAQMETKTEVIEARLKKGGERL